MNRKFLKVVALAATLAAPSLFAGDAPKEGPKEAAKELIAWEKSYGSVIKKAETESKPLIFDFYTGWCPHCVRMEKTTWKDQKLADLTKKFVVGKVNCDVEAVPVSRYRLTGYPTVIVGDSGGDQILRFEGYKDAPTLIRALEAYLAKADELQSAASTLRKDSADPASNITLGTLLASLDEHDKAAERFQKALKKAGGEQLVTAGVGYARACNATGKFKQAAKALEPVMTSAGDKPPAALLLAKAETEKGLGNAEAARGLFARVQSDFPGSPEAEAAAKAQM